ncbi:MAG TPA: hypothetical protein DCW41_03930 [Clostridiales bacterium]|nr:hypothetical protein [Clostridiales bacterium]
MAKVDNLSKYEENEPIIWKDRKRILGMPISFTRYSFDHNKFYTKVGLFNLSDDSLLLYRVLDIKLTRSFWQRIFGVGTVTLVSADQSTPNLVVKNIKDSERVRNVLSKIVEDERDEKRVLGKEMFGAAGAFDTEGVEHPIDTI